MQLCDIGGRFLQIMEEEESKNKERYKIGRYGATDIVGCLKRAYLNRTNWLPELPETLQIFEAGKAIHDWVYKQFAKLHAASDDFNLIETERELWIKEFEEFDIHMYMDAEVELFKKKYAIEVKSSKNLYYVRDSPSSEHIEQVNMYMYASDINRAKIMILEKESFHMVEHEIIFDQNILLESFDKVKGLHKCLVDGTEPDGIDDWHCGIWNRNKTFRPLCKYWKVCGKGVKNGQGGTGQKTIKT